MNITQIAASNLKGRTFEVPLSRATLIYGSNFSGKTAIATAIRLGMAGFLPPPIGKQAASIYNALAGDPEQPGQIEIRTRIEHHDYTSRWTRTSRGSTSFQGGVPPQIAMPAVLVDPRTFFAMSGPDRVQAIFEACEIQLTADDVCRVIKSAAPAAFPVHHRTRVLTEIAARAKHHLSAKSPQVAMADLLEEVRARHKQAKDLLKEQSAIIRAINWEGDVPQDVSVPMEQATADLMQNTSALNTLLERQRRIQTHSAEIERAKQRVREIQADLAITRWEKPPAPPTVTAADLQAATARHNEARTSNAGRAARESAIKKAIAAIRCGACPTCGTKGDALGAAQSELERQLSELPPPVDTAPLRQTELEIQQALAKHQTDLVAYQRDADTIRRLERDLEEMRRMAASAELEPVPVEAITAAEDARARAESRLSLLREAAAKWEAYQQTAAKRAEAERTMATATCEEAVIEDTIKVLRRLMADTIETAFGKVLAVTRAFTDGILHSPLEYTDELGRRVGPADIAQGCKAPVGAWISHEAFSGTEEAVAYAAFAVAIAMRCPVKIVILDELGRLDVNTRTKVLQRMVDLVDAGKIDQFIGIHTEPAEDVAGLVRVPISAKTTQPEPAATNY